MGKPTKQGDLRAVHVHRCLRLARAGDNCRLRCALAASRRAVPAVAFPSCILGLEDPIAERGAP
jgi:hypothetical protein